MASAALAQEHLLTVRETLGGIFVGGELSTAVAKAANPVAKPVLYRLLDKPQMKEHCGRIYLLFRYIGDKEDAATMEKRLKAGDVDWGEMNKVLSALSTMQLRGVSEAGAILERMIEPDYWHSTKFAVLTNFPHGVTNELAIYAVFAYARSGKSDWEAKAKSFKGKVRDPKVRTELEWRLDTNRISQHVQEFRHAKVQPVSPEFRKLLSQFFNGDMDNPGPATTIDVPRQPDQAQDGMSAEITVAKTLSPQELASLEVEALNAFQIALNAFLNNRYEQLALTLARGGKPLVPSGSKDDKTIPRALKELKQISAEGGFEFTKRLIKDLNPQATTHGELKGEVLSDGTITIRIPCLGSEPVAHKHLPGQDSPTIDEDGQLNIYMLKQGGQWYWNPFGW